MKNEKIIESLKEVKSVENIKQRILDEYEIPDDMKITDSMMLGYLLGYINKILERR